jgi:8-oxo-dGTP pyrophosphatase MutT (NUDIX family)
MPPAIASTRVPLRALIEERLRGTEPGGDPVHALVAGLTPEQTVELRKLLPAEFSRAAVLVPIVDRPEGLSVLLTQRASHLKHHPGQISFPGGRMESRDATLWEAALRETEEEIGLSREHVSLAGYLADHIVITGYVVTPAVAFVRPGFDLRLDVTEVEDVFEVPLDFVLDPANHVPRERHFGGHTFRAHDIPYQGRNIWGATAGMLMSLYRLLRET